jgi:hypothetical protein
MNTDMMERNRSDCKYVEIFTHHVGSIGAPSRRAVFIRGTNTRQAGRNTKANIFQKGSAGFKVTIDLIKKKCIHDRPDQKKCIKVVFFYVKNAGDRGFKSRHGDWLY